VTTLLRPRLEKKTKKGGYATNLKHGLCSLAAISEDRKKDILARTSLGRLGTPEDVAEAALFLAKAKFITGQVEIMDAFLPSANYA